jgi:hypothetical protein
MHRLFLLIMVAGIVSTVLDRPVGAEPTTSEKITKEARDTYEATKMYTAQQKESFQRTVHEELVAIQKQITALKDKANHASETTRAELDRSIRELEQKKDLAKTRMEDLRTSTDATWADVKAGMNAALADVRRAYTKARSYLP